MESNPTRLRTMAGAAVLYCLMAAPVVAGMPSPLPAGWSPDRPLTWWQNLRDPNGFNDAHFQAISFFVACVLLSAWGVKALWNNLGRDLDWLPQIGYGRALSGVVLWGLLSVIVLTMISGARELMTPGAWRKQGWTYQLDTPSAPASDARDERRRGLERLQVRLVTYATEHGGQFPPAEGATSDWSEWQVPGQPNLRFLYVAGRKVDDAGRLLAFEPSVDGDERLVLLTNGVFGAMSSHDIRKALANVETVATAETK